MRIQRNELESTRDLKGFKSKHLNNHFAELSLTVIPTVAVSLTFLLNIPQSQGSFWLPINVMF